MTPPVVTGSTSTRPGTGSGSVTGLAQPARRRRPLLVIVGVVVAALAALIVAVALNSVSETVLVWSTSSPVARGQPVTETALEPVEAPVSVADGLVAASVESRARLTSGRVWAADLPAGVLLSDALMVGQLPMSAGQALVGLRLDPGGFPTVGLRPGDAVQVVAVADDGGEPRLLVDRGTVEAVVVLAEQGPASPRLVTVQVPADRAAAVATAGLAGQVSLVVVP